LGELAINNEGSVYSHILASEMVGPYRKYRPAG
jgi:hypothetical protein